MALKEGICYYYFLRDTDNQKRSVTPFLISIENNIDPGIVPSYLLELSQVKEIVITRVYVQILVKRICRH
jgi:hypothetical protein